MDTVPHQEAIPWSCTTSEHTDISHRVPLWQGECYCNNGRTPLCHRPAGTPYPLEKNSKKVPRQKKMA